MTAHDIEQLLKDLISVPSVTESERENDAAVFIRDWLGQFDYFRQNPQNLAYVQTPLEGKEHLGLHAVIARIDAAVPTKRTVFFVSHFDVVDAHVYGELEGSAFSADELSRAFAKDFAPEAYMFGRGVMDMKCGVAIEMALLAEFAEDRNLFDVNIVAAFVGDEENSAAGIRGVVPYLADMVKNEGLEFIVGMNTEPCEPGRPGCNLPMIFLGTIGKLLPAFYVRGCEAHVGNYYHALSAALVASRIVELAEGNPQLADPSGEETPPSWSCLELKLLKDGYTVTVPDRALVYFNAFTTKKMPAKIIEEMDDLANRALEDAAATTKRSFEGMRDLGYAGDYTGDFDLKVVRYEEIQEIAKNNMGEAAFASHIKGFTSGLNDMDIRDRGVAIAEETLRIAGISGPLVMTMFLPPYLPARTDMTGEKKDLEIVSAARRLSAMAKEEFGVEMKFVEYFAGLCDLSYTGFQGNMQDLSSLQSNLPGWGEIYSVPLQDLMAVHMPVINLGPVGFDAHKKMERLELGYSLEILPQLIKKFMREL